MYPGTKVVVFGKTFKQSKELLGKIRNEFMPRSIPLQNEIKKISDNMADCGIYFKNGSWISFRIANENVRGARGNVIIIDESRMIPQHLVDTVLRPLNASPRTPEFLNDPKYKTDSKYKEMNKELYMSSAWYKASEMYQKTKGYVANSLDPRFKYFICALPYQLSIQEGLLMREAIENEMSEATFSDISFMMEREAKFYGSSENTLFDFKYVDARRILQKAIYPLEYYRNNNINIPKKANNEMRILSVDIALMASKKHNNDATCFTINSAIRTSDDAFVSNFVFIETKEGLVTEDLGITIMRYFYQYSCDYIALDCGGVGLSALDYIMRDRYDPLYGETYKALTVCNNDDLADRCRTKDARKVVYAIKGSAKLNNDMCLNLRAGFQNGNINLLVSEVDMEQKYTKFIKGFSNLSESDQAAVRLPYYQTSFMVNEIINLEYEILNGNVKVKEKTSMRKDRYSSILYSYYVVQEISRQRRAKSTGPSIASLLPFRKGIRRKTFG